MIRVFHCDDSLAYRRLVRAMLDAEPDITIVGEAADHPQALERIGEARPDVILLDMVVGPPDPGFARSLATAAPGARMIILSGHPPDRVDPELRVLAATHVGKSTAFDELAGAIRAAVTR